MVYAVKELFYSLQGEGAQAGRAAVFCRFSGCNLWSGREEDRVGAVCSFCDTDFVGVDGPGGGRYASAAELVRAMVDLCPERAESWGLAVCTGGEPLLQLDAPLVDALHRSGFQVAVETNGTRPLPPGLDWVCVSPKAGAGLAVTSGDELKVVFPQDGIDLEALSGLAFRHHFLQPMAGRDEDAHTAAAVRYCLDHPRWRLSLQQHRKLGIP